MKIHEITPSKSPDHWSRSCLLMTVFILLTTSPVVAQTEAELNPTDALRKEHAIIQKMAKAAEQTAEEIQKTGTVDPEHIAKFHDFFKNFADRCHHAKEEDELFPVVRAMNVDPVIIDLLIKEHEEGRILLGGIENSLASLTDKGTEPDTEALARYIFEYAQLMHRHIRTENEYLWPRVSRQLSAPQKEALAKAFHRIEVEDLGKGFHEKYHALAMDVLGKDTSL